MTVRLYNCSSQLITTTTTDGSGQYFFGNLMPSNYVVRFVLPAEHWDAFVELLDRDEQPVEGLAALLAGPSVEDLE